MIVLGCLVWSSVNAHTSITFSIQPGWNEVDEYDRIMMEQLRAEMIQDRIMRMRLAQGRYHGHRYIRGAMVPRYFITEDPYFMRHNNAYSRHDIRANRAAMRYCHRYGC